MTITETGHAFYGRVAGREGYILFNIELCEGCGCDCEGPNSITAMEHSIQLDRLGYIEREIPDSELLLWSDEVGGDGRCYCESCHTKKVKERAILTEKQKKQMTRADRLVTHARNSIMMNEKGKALNKLDEILEFMNEIIK